MSFIGYLKKILRSDETSAEEASSSSPEGVSIAAPTNTAASAHITGYSRPLAQALHLKTAGAKPAMQAPLVKTDYRSFNSLRINPDPNGSTPYRNARKAGNALLYLPIEIRKMIYSIDAHVGLVAMRRPDKDFVSTSFMQTCKQMWAEIKPIRLSACYFLVDYHACPAWGWCKPSSFEAEFKATFRNEKNFSTCNVLRIATPNLAPFTKEQHKSRPRAHSFWSEFIVACTQLQYVDVYSYDYFLKPSMFLTPSEIITPKSWTSQHCSSASSSGTSNSISMSVNLCTPTKTCWVIPPKM